MDIDELAELRADAERYRWLRDIVALRDGNLEAFVALGQLDFMPDAADIDAYVDACMGAERGEVV